jgi:hypothetical protein
VTLWISAHSVQVNYHYICHLSSPLIIIEEFHHFVNPWEKVSQFALLPWYRQVLQWLLEFHSEFEMQLCFISFFSSLQCGLAPFWNILGHLVQRLKESVHIYALHISSTFVLLPNLWYTINVFTISLNNSYIISYCWICKFQNRIIESFLLFENGLVRRESHAYWLSYNNYYNSFHFSYRDFCYCRYFNLFFNGIWVFESE